MKTYGVLKITIFEDHLRLIQDIQKEKIELAKQLYTGRQLFSQYYMRCHQCSFQWYENDLFSSLHSFPCEIFAYNRSV